MDSTPSVPGSTPTTFPQSGEAMQNLIQILAKAAQRPQLPTPVPAPIPQQQPTTPPGYMQPSQNWGPAWGKERAMYSIGASIQNAWSQHKAKQLSQAESDWTQLLSAMQSGNQQALNFILQDPKKLKNMAKALNQDWLNPEKTDVYSQALQSALQKHDQKQQAAQGLKAMFQKLIGERQQPNLSPDQKQQMEKEILGRAPVSTQPDAGLKEVLPLITESMKEDASQKRLDQSEEYNTFKQEQAQKFETFTRDNQQQFSERMERLREVSRDQQESNREAAMFKALGIRLSAEDQRRMQITPAQVNTEINGTLTSMRQQLSQATSQLKTLQTELTNHPLYSRMGGTNQDDVKAAKAQVDNMQAAINYIEKKRTAIIAGKSQLDDVVDQAQSIMSGTIPGETPVK